MDLILQLTLDPMEFLSNNSIKPQKFFHQSVVFQKTRKFTGALALSNSMIPNLSSPQSNDSKKAFNAVPMSQIPVVVHIFVMFYRSLQSLNGFHLVAEWCPVRGQMTHFSWNAPSSPAHLLSLSAGWPITSLHFHPTLILFSPDFKIAFFSLENEAVCASMQSRMLKLHSDSSG